MKTETLLYVLICMVMGLIGAFHNELGTFGVAIVAYLCGMSMGIINKYKK